MWTIKDLDLNAVMAFAQVAEEQSFRGAARALNVSKSALSQRVARLEERLGVQLLARNTRNVRLTDIGESYYQAVAPALGALRAAETLVADAHQRPRGLFRLTAPVELGQAVMGDSLAWFAQRYPEVDVWVELTDRHVNLIEEGFDLALRVGPLRDSSLISRRVSKPQTKRLYASPGYIDARGLPDHPEQLAEHACLIMTGQSEATTWRLHGPNGPRAIAIRPKIAVNSWGVLRKLALAGQGIARLPELHVKGAQESGALIEVLAGYAAPPVACYAVYPSARQLSPAIRAMIGSLIRRLGADIHQAPAAYDDET